MYYCTGPDPCKAVVKNTASAFKSASAAISKLQSKCLDRIQKAAAKNDHFTDAQYQKFIENFYSSGKCHDGYLKIPADLLTALEEKLGVTEEDLATAFSGDVSFPITCIQSQLLSFRDKITAMTQEWEKALKTFEPSE